MTFEEIIELAKKWASDSKQEMSDEELQDLLDRMNS